MKYGLILTIDGGKETMPVADFRFKRPAIRRMQELSKNPEEVSRLSGGKDVTCIEVINNRNLTTYEYVPMI